MKRCLVVSMGVLAIVLLLWLWIDRSATPEPESAPLTVMTLNTAHGRGTGLHQALLKREAIETHLDAIAAVVRREQPDVVGLQEVDGPSVWSGKFNHVEYLSTTAKLPYSFRGEHMQAFGLSYGTAFLARTPLTDSVSLAFSPSPPTPSKGFVVSQVAWPERPDIRVTVASAHLDFSRSAVRTSQVREMVDTLSKVEQPLIVMGDFNCEMLGEDDSLRTLCKQLALALRFGHIFVDLVSV